MAPESDMSYTISSDSVEINSLAEGTLPNGDRMIGISGDDRKKVVSVISVYYKTTLIASATVTVTSDDERGLAFQQWKADTIEKLKGMEIEILLLKKKIKWDNTSTGIEKLAMFGQYVDSYAEYKTEGTTGYSLMDGCGDCSTATYTIMSLAKDMGLHTEVYGYGSEGHVAALVEENGVQWCIDAQPNNRKTLNAMFKITK